MERLEARSLTPLTGHCTEEEIDRVLALVAAESVAR
jgi:hypothetical protein